MNKAFQEYKIAVGTFDTKKIIECRSIIIDMEEYISIPLIKNRETSKQKRAREKRELRKEIEERGY